MRLRNQLKNHPTSRALISKYKEQRAIVKPVLQRARQQSLCAIAEEEKSNMIKYGFIRATNADGESERIKSLKSDIKAIEHLMHY